MLKSAIKQHNFKLQIANESLSAFPSRLHSQLANIETVVAIHYHHKQCHPNSHKLIANFSINIPESLYKNISWQPFDSQKVTRQDFLWDNTCLEVFIGHTQTSEYVEINASPQGQFALYHFDDYRQPKQMPPRKLTIKNQPSNHTQIIWLPSSKTYERNFSLELNQLPTSLQIPNLLNPTVILNFTHADSITPLFFACQHASPADFHKQKNWQKIYS